MSVTAASLEASSSRAGVAVAIARPSVRPAARLASVHPLRGGLAARRRVPTCGQHHHEHGHEPSAIRVTHVRDRPIDSAARTRTSRSAQEPLTEQATMSVQVRNASARTLQLTGSGRLERPAGREHSSTDRYHRCKKSEWVAAHEARGVT